MDRPLVSFSFDDFPKTAISVGATLLEQENWRGTYYTSAALANSTNHHGKHFDAKDLCDLETRGHEIAGHTLSHIDVTKVALPKLLGECEQNRLALAEMGVQGPICNFAYPFGNVSASLKAELSSNFRSMRGIQDGAHYGRADLNELKSQALDTPAHMAKAHKIIEGLPNRPGWLILFTHDIVENPSDWGCTPAQFARIVAAVKQSGAEVLPVDQALDKLEAQSGKSFYE